MVHLPDKPKREKDILGNTIDFGSQVKSDCGNIMCSRFFLPSVLNCVFLSQFIEKTYE